MRLINRYVGSYRARRALSRSIAKLGSDGMMFVLEVASELAIEVDPKMSAQTYGALAGTMLSHARKTRALVREQSR